VPIEGTIAAMPI